MPLEPKEIFSVEEEEKILKETLDSLKKQTSHTSHRFRVESVRARDLTTDLVLATRSEDKAMLASDEAVSHALRDQRKENLEVLAKQIEKPYFARIILEEDDEKTDDGEGGCLSRSDVEVCDIKVALYFGRFFY